MTSVPIRSISLISYSAWNSSAASSCAARSSTHCFAQETLVDKQFIPRADIDRLLDWLPALRAPGLDRITPRALYSCITVESLVPIERRLRTPS